ncbi:OLC1v1015203C2 [Oldenlandia corymbosa var. corymbosa]|nr:OLC1v1015203C2 [Oldenlandia corymbosa var. corymbosa]
MGFLHKLWDETLAGPTPESGLGKLRKYNSFSGSRSSSSPVPEGARDDALVPISRSITVLRRGTPPTVDVNLAGDSTGSVPSSPSTASATPTSPFSPGAPGHGGPFKEQTRRKINPASGPNHNGEPRSPTPPDYDSYW